MNTASTIVGSQISHRCSALHTSVLALTLAPRELSRLEGLGEVVMVPSGTKIFQKGEAADFLYVVLDGVLVPEVQLSEQPSFWVGPGDVCGEVGFVLGSPRSTTMIVLGPAPRLWRIHRDVLALLGGASGVAVTRLLTALGRVIRARLDPVASRLAEVTEAEYCDHHHPRVAALAQQLRRATPFETACAIWSHVWSMPYRFGSWQWSASDTLGRGHGMCTTKAVLQVALMRAAGIEGGYVKATLDGALVRACMAPVYHPRFERATFKHYYAAARLSGRWIPLDASFSRGSLALIAETEPSVKPYVTWNALDHGYAHGSATLRGTDPFAIEVHPDLADVMCKTPTYDAKNADGMNVLLDRAQGYVAPVAAYAVQAEHALAAGSPLSARGLVMAGLAAEAMRLHHRPAGTRAA
jgi:CRP-like cAMP-binding protein